MQNEIIGRLCDIKSQLHGEAREAISEAAIEIALLRKDSEDLARRNTMLIIETEVLRARCNGLLARIHEYETREQ